MSKVFSFWATNAREQRVTSYFTSDRRRARRFARVSGMRFVTDREGPQRSYAAGATIGQILIARDLNAREQAARQMREGA